MSTLIEVDLLRVHFSQVKVPQILSKRFNAGRNSVGEFVEQMQGEPINSLARSYLQGNHTLEGIEFICKSECFQFNDGQFALSLWVQKEDGKIEVPICQTSFSDLTFLSDSRGENFGKQPLPVIVQLQGRNLGVAGGSFNEPIPSRKAEYDTTKQVLEKIRWEPILVELGMIWAVKEGYPALYSLPARLNKYWRRFDEERCQAFK